MNILGQKDMMTQSMEGDGITIIIFYVRSLSVHLLWKMPSFRRAPGASIWHQQIGLFSGG